MEVWHVATALGIHRPKPPDEDMPGHDSDVAALKRAALAQQRGEDVEWSGPDSMDAFF